MTVEANLELLMRHAREGRITIERYRGHDCHGVKVSFETDATDVAIVVDAGGEVVGELPSAVRKFAVAAPTLASAVVVLADCARRRGWR